MIDIFYHIFDIYAINALSFDLLRASFVFKRESFANHSINFGGELTTNNLREVFLFELTHVFYVLFASLGFFT